MLSRLRNQKGIKEFWSTVPARSGVDAEVGRDLELVVELESGNVWQIPPDIPNKGQIRGEREKDRKQSYMYMEQYLIGGNSSKVTTQKVSEATTVPATGLGPSSSHTKNN